MLIAVYFIIAIAEIVGEYLGLLPLVFLTKPLLMPILGYWFYQQTKNVVNTKYRKLLLFSILFAFGGDTFLMFVTYNENFFLLGLASFLIGQLCYAFAFINSIKNSSSSPNKVTRSIFALLFAVYYVVLMRILFPELGEFLVPVLVYGTTICFMGLTAAFRLQKVSMESFKLVFTGAMLFVISDTIIAVNKFIYKDELWNAQVLIMVTYVLAQYIIAKGSVVYLKQPENQAN